MKKELHNNIEALIQIRLMMTSVAQCTFLLFDFQYIVEYNKNIHFFFHSLH